MAAPAESLRNPEQPVFVYDIHKEWKENVESGPDWRGGFPPKPQEANYNFLGIDLISPIVIAAGPSSGKKYSDFYLGMGYGIVTEKTKRTKVRESNPAPNVVIVRQTEPVTLENLGESVVGSTDEKEYLIYFSGTNSFGNPSSEMPDWQAELKSQIEEVSPGQVLACSVTATMPEEPVEHPTEYAINDLLKAVKNAVEAGAKIVELNLACPNVTDHPEEGQMFLDPYLVKTVIARAHELFPDVKIGFKAGVFETKEQMRKVLADCGADFISLINAVGRDVTNEEGGDILPGRRNSGTFGMTIKNLALERVKWAAEIREEEGLSFGIIGGGGVTSVSDIDEFREAGADLVFSASYVWHDPLLAYEYALSKGDISNQ